MSTLASAGAAGAVAAPPVQSWRLEKEQELRFEAGKTPISLKLLKGQAESFGAEIVRDSVYKFADANVGVFTWHGCTIEVVGEVSAAYISRETPMRLYVNCHAALEQKRRLAKSSGGTGPRVLLVGPPDVGKTTIARILANYGARQGSQPLYVDLDVSEGSSGVPGAIAAVAVDKPIDVTDGLSGLSPLVYHFGHTSLRANEKLFTVLVEQLGESTLKRCEVDEGARHSGTIINLSGTASRVIVDVVREAFHVDVVLVVDHERMYNDLSSSARKPGARPTSVVKLAKSGGVVVRDEATRERHRGSCIRQYLYGGLSEDLSPHSFDVPFDVLRIWKIGAPAVPDVCLPIGAERPDNETQLVAIRPSKDLLHAVLAVSAAEKEVGASNPYQVVTSHCLGFVCVQLVDEERRMLTVLAPAPFPLPTTTLLLTSLVFMDVTE